jgi:antitoxin (DNA-binding transcriptional repressor) of toxin-antitoxin stability system
MTKIINLKDLRLNMDSYIAQVKKGNSFLVMKRSEQAFLISPFEFEEVDEKEDAKGWKTLIDFTKLTKDGKGIDAHKLLAMLRKSIIKDEQNTKIHRQVKQR